MKEYIVKGRLENKTGFMSFTVKQELIRCKDCKYNDAQQWVACTLIPQMFGKTADNNFCSYAEPKVEP